MYAGAHSCFKTNDKQLTVTDQILTETNLAHAQVDELTLSGFHEIIRNDRNGRPGEGFPMYVAEHLEAVKVNEFEIRNLEAMWVKRKAGSNSILMCLCNRPPYARAE